MDIKRRVIRKCKHLRQKLIMSACLVRSDIVMALPSLRKKHALPGELIVSLTSYKPRFPVLAATLKTLLSQSVQPDRLILWISHEDVAHLTDDIKALTKYGLEIKETENTRSFKKIIPTLALYPDAFIVTADDDVCYAYRWLETLSNDWNASLNPIVCHRSHRIHYLAPLQPAPYKNWEHSIKGPMTSTDIFPTGIGGVLYPPHCFDNEVMNAPAFMELCPRGDDIWLFWMARRNNKTYKQTAVDMEFLNWQGSQDVALWHDNLSDGHNDVQINNMINAYGFPGQETPRQDSKMAAK